MKNIWNSFIRDLLMIVYPTYYGADRFGMFLKVATGIFVFWPILLITCAMILPPRESFVDIPLLTILFLFIAPITFILIKTNNAVFGGGVVAVAKIEKFRPWLGWLRKAAEVECLAGLLFAVLPLSYYRPLIPYFALAFVALGLSKRGWVRDVMYAVIGVLSFIFILIAFFGSDEVKAATYPLPADYHAVYCATAENHSPTPSDASFDIGLSGGCFHGMITLPDTKEWKKVTITRSNNPGDYFIPWCGNEPAPRESLITSGTDLTEALTNCRERQSFWHGGIHTWRTGPLQMAVIGHGTVHVEHQ